MTSSILSTPPVDVPRPASALTSAHDDDDLSAIVAGLYQDAKAIDDRNRQLLERVRGLQLMIEARRRDLD
jgi:hypothetical protein